MLVRLCWGGLLTLCLPVMAWAQSQVWVPALEAALLHDPTYLAAKHAHQMARAQKNQATAAWNPEWTANGAVGVNHLWQEANQNSRQNTYTSQQLGVQWRKPLINRELEVQERQANLRNRWADALLQSASQDLMNRLVEAALRWLDTSVLYRQARYEESHQQRSNAATEQALLLGEGTLLDKLEGQTRLRLLEVQLDDAKRATIDATRVLEAITGNPWAPSESHATDLSRPTKPFPTLEPEAHWLAQAIDHPELKARQVAVEVAKSELDRIAARYRPRIDGVVTLSRSASDTVSALNQQNTQWGAGVQLNWPLHAGGRDIADTEVAQAALQKAEAERDAVALKLSIDVQSAWQGLRSALNRIESLQKAAATTDAMAVATDKAYRAGQSRLTDTWALERQMQQLSTENMRFRLEALRHWWRLRLHTGQGNSQTLTQLEYLL